MKPVPISLSLSLSRSCSLPPPSLPLLLPPSSLPPLSLPPPSLPPPSLSSSLPRSLSPSLSLSLGPSLAVFLARSPSLAPSLPRSLAPWLHRGVASPRRGRGSQPLRGRGWPPRLTATSRDERLTASKLATRWRRVVHAAVSLASCEFETRERRNRFPSAARRMRSAVSQTTRMAGYVRRSTRGRVAQTNARRLPCDERKVIDMQIRFRIRFRAAGLGRGRAAAHRGREIRKRRSRGGRRSPACRRALATPGHTSGGCVSVSALRGATRSALATRCNRRICAWMRFLRLQERHASPRSRTGAAA